MIRGPYGDACHLCAMQFTKSSGKQTQTPRRQAIEKQLKAGTLTQV